MKENFLSVVIALLLASGIFFWLLVNFDSFDVLQTNVIGAEQEQLLWDVVIQTYTDRIEVIANKEIPSVEALSVMFLRNQNEVSPNFDMITSSWSAVVTEAFASRVTIFVNDLNGLSQNDVILELPLDGEVTQITVSDIVLLFSDGSSERASLSTR